jgi:hypothetical protein
MKTIVLAALLTVLAGCSHSGADNKVLRSDEITTQGQQAFLETKWCGTKSDENGFIETFIFRDQNGRTGDWSHIYAADGSQAEARRFGWDMDKNLLTAWWLDYHNLPYAIDAYTSYQTKGGHLQLLLKSEHSSVVSVYTACD